jgi:hypothetical protein
MRLLTFFKQIPEFNQLKVEDKVTLIKYNLMPLVIINGSLSYKAETNEVVETETDIPWNASTMLELNSNDVNNEVKKIFDSFVRIAQYDQRIILLALVVLILTKGFATDGEAEEPILSDGLAVYRAQSNYTELLWKYMETVHGYEKAVHIFQEFVFHFTSWQALDSTIRRNIRQLLTPNDMNGLLPLMKSLLHLP